MQHADSPLTPKGRRRMIGGGQVAPGLGETFALAMKLQEGVEKIDRL
ncbi:MAG: hypothetical protein ACM3Q9_02315 [Methanosarcina sp.]